MGWAGRITVAVAGTALALAARAQQVGDTVPESSLQGPTYSLRPAPGTPPGRYVDATRRAYVLALQQRLPTHGYRAGPPTGQEDPTTEQAILAYETDAGLPADTKDIGALKRTLDHLTYARPAVFAGRQQPPAPAAPEPAPEAPPNSAPTMLHPPGEPLPPDTGAAAPNDAQPPADAALPPPGDATAPPNAVPPGNGPSPPQDGAVPDTATIRAVQQKLKDRGYDVDVTGKLDVYTLNAIKVFQAANGLPRDGRIDGYLLDLLKQ
ncbi:MAG TPA: peptidoglycan-binding domain-containing protein [Stellaceae bacterium]|nr:peptidoglycan-binding domain-containing protein [Stellaceae bacterium]